MLPLLWCRRLELVFSRCRSIQEDMELWCVENLDLPCCTHTRILHYFTMMQSSDNKCISILANVMISSSIIVKNLKTDLNTEDFRLFVQILELQSSKINCDGVLTNDELDFITYHHCCNWITYTQSLFCFFRFYLFILYIPIYVIFIICMDKSHIYKHLGMMLP